MNFCTPNWFEVELLQCQMGIQRLENIIHQIPQQLLPRIELNTMKTWELDEFFFHFINDDGITLLCMTDKEYKRKQAFAFLQDLRKALK